ncbi:MAG: D-alanyl-D-alanine carboxypeptidase [Oscillospiraceae bacterium]|nr:D-alanyl-D-alanine carboxypeptidase [Oscillospiraceae bacterium]
MKNINKLVALIATFTSIIGVTGFNLQELPEPVRVSHTFSTPETSAVSSIVMDADTGKIFYSKNADEIRAVASLTKVMTTLLTLEASEESGDLDKQFKVCNTAIYVEGTSMGLRENDIVTRRALCYGMMLPSGNDASNAAAVSVSGSVQEFATLMNERAVQIGMTDTVYKNPHGLDQDGHLSTARDMAILTAYALNHSSVRDEFRNICKSQSVQLEFGNPPYKRWLSNNNKLLHKYDDCIGVKTGFTDAARRCLITAAQRDGRTLVAVTLNAPDDWNDHIKMLDYSFEKVNVLYKNYG